MQATFRLYIAEFIGTFILVFVGTCAVISNDFSQGALGNLGIALVFGLVVMAMIYAIGDVSGAHMNPAVTIAFWQLGLFERRYLLGYISAQCSAAMLASSALFFLFPEVKTMGETLPHIGLTRSLLMEIFLTFVLMFVIIHVSEGSKEKGLLAGVAIGGVVGMEALFAGPLTGASMNPARSLGPGIYVNQWTSLWLYIVGPIIGALLATVSCRLLRGKQCC